MHFDILTLFPQVIDAYMRESIMLRAISSNIVSVSTHNLRDWAIDKHHVTDDTPFGGGGGMVMKVEPIFSAVEMLQQEKGKYPVILMSPQGRKFDHAVAQELSRQERMLILCGRYEGVDERIREHLVTDEISIGDYVVSGGELPAMVLIEAVTRLLPGALGAPNGASEDSFASGLLEYPHYTRPAAYRGWGVPDVLLSGNHLLISRWRRKQAWLRTLERRPELAKEIKISKLDIKLLKEIASEGNEKYSEMINRIIKGAQ